MCIIIKLVKFKKCINIMSKSFRRLVIRFRYKTMGDGYGKTPNESYQKKNSY